ncbi:hypothetical protein HGRIS_014279 [Hohenbuehelia grisea]|uniref:Peptide hydrolase n=1 Tax=Hohenbuehelia grisea TaxID=104357 RepID=A0ABR3JV47_9AGAR
MKLSLSVALCLTSLALAQEEADASRWGWNNYVSSKSLQKNIKLPNILRHSHKLLEHSKLSNGTRAFGTKGHNATARYIKQLLDRTGYYNTELQSFPFFAWSGTSKFSADGKEYETRTATYGKAGEVTAPVVLAYATGCLAANFGPAIKGNIALIKRGDCDLGLKVAHAGTAGAAGVILYNNVPGSFSGTLGASPRPEGPYTPVGSISGEDGDALAASIAGGKAIVGTLIANVVAEDRWSSNVIATTKRGDQRNIVMAGAHSDSVPAGPGINDDGSGTAGLLELALQLPKFQVRNAVRFAWWTAEEVGLVGSRYYTAHLTPAQNQKIALYLNFDMIASPNGGFFILDGDGDTFGTSGPAGSDHIEQTFKDYFTSAKIQNGTAAFTGRSDYGPFLDAGIPAGGVNTGAEGIKTEQQAAWWGGKAGIAYDPCYHQACDGIENLDTNALLVNTKAAGHAIATYANTLRGIPRTRNQTVTRRSSSLHSELIGFDDGCKHDEDVKV